MLYIHKERECSLPAHTRPGIVELEQPRATCCLTDLYVECADLGGLSLNP